MLPRTVIYEVRPSAPHGCTAKVVVGEAVRVSADIFKDGHDDLGTHVRYIRRGHPALQRLCSIHFHDGDDPQVIAYSKHTDDRSDVVLTVVSLDPHGAQERRRTGYRPGAMAMKVVSGNDEVAPMELVHDDGMFQAKLADGEEPARSGRTTRGGTAFPAPQI